VFFIISIILILLIAVVVIKLLKKSISSFNSILGNLAVGDFTVKIESYEKSKSLASVSKEMDCTIQEVAVAIHGIADGASVQSNELIVINDTFSK